MPSTGIEIQLIDVFTKQLTNRGVSTLINAAIKAAQSFLGIQKKTNEIEKSVKKLTKQYYEKGIDYLQLAENSNSNRRSYLLSAIDELMSASKIGSKDVFINSKLLMSTCFLAMNEDTNAVEIFNEAYSSLHSDFFAIAITRGRIAAEDSGIDPDTFGTLNQNNDLKLIEIYTDAAKDLYSELRKAASALEEKGYKVNIPSGESKVDEVRSFYEKQSDLNYQRSRGM